MIAKEAIQRVVGRLGYEFVATKKSTYAPTVLNRTLALVGPIATVIDIGASDGRWSERTRAMLPNADFVLFEANPVHRAALSDYAQQSGSHVEFAAASDHEGINFYTDEANPLGGVLQHVPSPSTTGRFPPSRLMYPYRETICMDPTY